MKNIKWVVGLVGAVSLFLISIGPVAAQSYSASKLIASEAPLLARTCADAMEGKPFNQESFKSRGYQLKRLLGFKTQILTLKDQTFGGVPEFISYSNNKRLCRMQFSGPGFQIGQTGRAIIRAFEKSGYKRLSSGNGTVFEKDGDRFEFKAQLIVSAGGVNFFTLRKR